MSRFYRKVISNHIDAVVMQCMVHLSVNFGQSTRKKASDWIRGQLYCDISDSVLWRQFKAILRKSQQWSWRRVPLACDEHRTVYYHRLVSKRQAVSAGGQSFLDNVDCVLWSQNITIRPKSLCDPVITAATAWGHIHSRIGGSIDDLTQPTVQRPWMTLLRALSIRCMTIAVTASVITSLLPSHSFVLVCSWLFYHEINRFYHFSSLIYNQTHV